MNTSENYLISGVIKIIFRVCFCSSAVLNKSYSEKSYLVKPSLFLNKSSDHGQYQEHLDLFELVRSEAIPSTILV